eukprot:jgi/Chrzof1/14478/Cz09g04090.t1
MLQPLHDVYVPAILGIGMTCGTLACFIATSLVQGTPLSDLAEQSLLTPEACVAAVEALQAVHSRGVLHRDVRLDHMILVDGGSSQQQRHKQQCPGSSAGKGAPAGCSSSSHVRPQVMLPDFDNAVACTCKAEMVAEMNELQQELQHRCTRYEPVL